MRFYYFDNFRAIAILIIVVGHCYNSWSRNSFFEIALANSISGGTALFVFISGFFFRQIFYKNFNQASFLRKKFINVGLPHLFLSVLFIFIIFLENGEVYFPFELSQHSDLQIVYAIIANILTGAHLVAYWYIPFVMLIFLISPLLIGFIKLSSAVKISITLTMFVVASFVQRPILGVNPLHSVVYFLPFYLLGIVYSENLSVLNRWMKQYFLIAFLPGCWLLS